MPRCRLRVLDGIAAEDAAYRNTTAAATQEMSKPAGEASYTTPDNGPHTSHTSPMQHTRQPAAEQRQPVQAPPVECESRRAWSQPPQPRQRSLLDIADSLEATPTASSYDAPLNHSYKDAGTVDWESPRYNCLAPRAGIAKRSNAARGSHVAFSSVRREPQALESLRHWSTGHWVRQHPTTLPQPHACSPHAVSLRHWPRVGLTWRFRSLSLAEISARRRLLACAAGPRPTATMGRHTERAPPSCRLRPAYRTAYHLPDAA